MAKICFIIIIFNLNICFSQTKSEIDSLLIEISKIEYSKNISKSEQAKKIIIFGENSLPILAEFFTDSTLTNVTSNCQGRNLSKAELAIIMADQVEFMPAFTLTSIQNCTLESCENDPNYPNFIEYYLGAIKNNGFTKFKTKYIAWLSDNERKRWRNMFKSKKQIKSEKRKKRKENRK